MTIVLANMTCAAAVTLFRATRRSAEVCGPAACSPKDMRPDELLSTELWQPIDGVTWRYTYIYKS